MVIGAPEMPFDDKEFETEQDLRALQRAADIKNSPERQSRVDAMIEKQRKALDQVAGDGDKLSRHGFRRI